MHLVYFNSNWYLCCDEEYASSIRSLVKTEESSVMYFSLQDSNFYKNFIKIKSCSIMHECLTHSYYSLR